jgi:hypothetical protein
MVNYESCEEIGRENDPHFGRFLAAAVAGEHERVSEMEHCVFGGRCAAEAGEEEQRVSAWICGLDAEAKRGKRSGAARN